ncbi:MAG: NAD-dependent epimerase/dehydratase family protein [Bacteroidales bacterium]|nr:NAD-dependent epimerase/dehydratase family protein [Bacteroidales bacterium]HOI32840.1 NAD-dependent epimerase/dehydratase family protein [Bacteroidales bacterium]
MKQVILGAGGSIGKGLAKELKKYKTDIRLVSRKPVKVNEDDELVAANLLGKAAVSEAVKDCEVAYLVAGLKYNADTWEKQWPVIMDNVIEACKLHNCKLVFFDNVYMYDPAMIGNMSEECPVNPASRKGKVRAAIAHKLIDEVNTGKLTALIARAADFYGPGEVNSIISETVVKNFAKGKKANWMGVPSVPHSFTYVPDAAKATAMLGNSKDGWGQVWHLPTAAPALTGLEWIENIASEMGVKPKFNVVGMTMIKMLGWFIPFLREMREMMYQYDRPYVFDSTKFEKKFSLKPTPYVVGIREMVADYKKQVNI